MKNVNGYVLSASEAAKRLGVVRQTLRRWDLPKICIGKFAHFYAEAAKYKRTFVSNNYLTSYV